MSSDAGERNGRAGQVMIADDDPAAISLFETGLSIEGYVVASSSTVEDCLEASDRIDPDVVVVAARLSGRSGLDLIRALRDRRMKARIIALASGVAHEHDHFFEEAKEAGADVTLWKPLPWRALLSVVRELVASG